MNNEQFFGTEGLTTTSANHIANIAKEYYNSIEAKLRNINLYKETLKILGSDKVDVIKEVSDISSIEKDLKDIAEAKSLIAWLREAIKCKEALYNEIKNLSFLDYIKNSNLVAPVEKEVTDQDWFNTLSVKDRNKYYTLETYASTFGLFIHENAPFKVLRDNFHKFKENPTEVSENPNYVLIKTKTFPISIEEIDNVYFSLQERYREYQAELNSYKNKKDEWLKDQEVKNLAEFEKAMSEHNRILSEKMNEYNKYIIAEKDKIKKLKIVIPNNLQNIYKKINSL